MTLCATPDTASVRSAAPTGGPADAHDPATIRALTQACADFGADGLERLALFEAALVASNLRADYEDGDRLGVLAQNRFWGKAAARRDPYTAATVFLRQARRLRSEPAAPHRAAALATRVQGRSRRGLWWPTAAVDSRLLRWRHAKARRTAERILVGDEFAATASRGGISCFDRPMGSTA